VAVDISQALTQQLISLAQVGLEESQVCAREADLPVEVADIRLRLNDQRLLGSDLIVESLDQGEKGVHLRLDVLDLGVDVVQLTLVAHLRPDSLVVGETGLIDGRRVAPVAVDRGRRLQGVGHPEESGNDHGCGKAESQGQILTKRLTPM